MRGSDVAELQSILQLIGYRPGAIDGIFGNQTEEAVKAFQRNNALTADGIVGPATYAKLEPILLGYDLYTIKKEIHYLILPSNIIQRFMQLQQQIRI